MKTIIKPGQIWLSKDSGYKIKIIKVWSTGKVDTEITSDNSVHLKSFLSKFLLENCTLQPK